MNWFKNMKLRLKFIVTFGLILLLVLLMSLQSTVSMNSINTSYKDILSLSNHTQNETVAILDAVTDLRVISVQYYRLVEQSNINSIRAEYDSSYENLLNFANEYINIIESDSKHADLLKEELAIMNELIKYLPSHKSIFYQYLDSSIEDGPDTVATENIFVELGKSGDIIVEKIQLYTDEVVDVLATEMNSLSKESSISVITVIVLAIVVLLLTVILSMILSENIVTNIQALKDIAVNTSEGILENNIRTNNTDEIGELSNAIGDMSDTFENILNDINALSNQLEAGNISYRINSKNYKGVFKGTIEAINLAVNNLVDDTLYSIEKIQEFANGEFDAHVKDFPGDKRLIKEGVLKAQASLSNISKDILKIIEETNNGNLEYRMNSQGYIGQYIDMINGINSLVESFVLPIKETQNALEQFTKGNFAHKITREYKGEFNNIKNAVNFTAETVGSYINEISDVLTKMSNKDFNVSIDREYLGDFEAIKQAVNLIVQNLNILIGEIISSAEQVSSGARQISESSISLAQGATEQAETVERLNHNIKLISDQTISNTESSNRANELALRTKENANNGSKQMDEMLLAMEEINTASNSISNIIKVIDDIAFQTNILALNAAVEAARAGEHGKGFAVVAEEVRNLAARSQQAAKETTALIETSVVKVGEGSKIANTTAESLNKIVQEIEEISNLVSESAISSKEQEKSINEIMLSVGEISSVTQTNTATSEESAAASEELSSQSEVLYSSVSDFKLKDSGNHMDNDFE